ncbi:hypothetical protein [uncultured Roseobacter sp.]|uniref:hypothetical protein n=1 Tax=uncultured Roseobacter sp. TaxID=114847 RepID=UPI00261EB830|nr:hypothetical protein [uncultured Roseobacter sp.]
MSRAAAALAGLGLLAGCAGQNVSADRAELENMWRGFLAPKSTPKQMVTAFDDFCISGPRDEAGLRAAGYVPLPQRVAGARAWVVDDRRPAVALSDRMCVVHAKARTGQTAAFAGYVAETFPTAVATDPAPFGKDIEAVWQVPGPAIIATERRRDVDFFVYTLIHYRAGAA